MKKLLPFVVAALLVPGVAFAKNPHPNSGKHKGQGKAKVLYILKGTVTDYSSGSSITITVKHANRHGKVLVSSTPLALALDGNTKVVLHHHITAIGVGDRVIVKIRYKMTKGVEPSVWLGDFETVPARQVIDQHAASTR